VVGIDDGPKFEVLATNELHEEVFATPASVGGDFLVRTEKHLFAFRQ